MTQLLFFVSSCFSVFLQLVGVIFVVLLLGVAYTQLLFILVVSRFHSHLVVICRLLLLLCRCLWKLLSSGCLQSVVVTYWLFVVTWWLFVVTELLFVGNSCCLISLIGSCYSVAVVSSSCSCLICSMSKLHSRFHKSEIFAKSLFCW